VASLSFENEQSIFHKYYGDYRQTFADAEVQFRTLIASLLAHDGAFAETPKVISRVKSEQECLAKFQRKYQTELEKQGTLYEIKDYVTDVVGVRVTCLYESEIAEVSRVLVNNFTSLGVTDKIAKLESTDDAFGYRGLHLDLAINAARRELPEYGRSRDINFEVQIRTIIQDGWSILDHKMKYKRAIPTALKRRINVLAALFELADHEFLAIREATLSLEIRAREELAGGTDHVPNVAAAADRRVEDEPFLNVFQFLEIASTFFPHYSFWPEKADAFVQEILKWSPSLSAKDFKRLLVRHLPRIERYAEYARSRGSFYPNPFTQMRHALFLSDPDVYCWMLYDVQRHAFRVWLQSTEAAGDKNTESASAVARASEFVRLSVDQGTAGHYAEAITAAEQAVALAPELAAAWRTLAINVGQAGDHERARQAWRVVDRLSTLQPIDYTVAAAQARDIVRNDQLSQSAWQQFAIVMERDGRGAEAVSEARAMMAARPDIHKSFDLLIEQLVNPCPVEIDTLIEAMLELAPNEAHYVHLHGVALRKAGRNAEAVPHLRYACEALPSNGTYWYALGRALEDCGEVSAACAAYRECVACQSGSHLKAADRMTNLNCDT
jgi:putative GTP pyrophosphokinase